MYETVEEMFPDKEDRHALRLFSYNIASLFLFSKILSLDAVELQVNNLKTKEVLYVFTSEKMNNNNNNNNEKSSSE